MKQHDRRRAAALDLLAAATVIQMRDDAAELAKLAKEPAKSMPIPNGRAGLLVLSLALRKERERSRRLLDLLVAN